MAGFYLKAELAPNGAVVTNKILVEKAKHLRMLERENSLGKRYNNLSNTELIKKVEGGRNGL